MRFMRILRVCQWLLILSLFILMPDSVLAGPGAIAFRDFVQNRIISQALTAFYGITAVGVFYLGLKTIVESDKEDSYSTLNNATLTMFIGFGIIATASIFANTFTSSGFSSDVVSSINLSGLTGSIYDVGRFLRNLSFALFVLMITLAGVQIVSNPGDEGTVSSQKKILTGSCIGVMIMLIAQAIVTSVSSTSPNAILTELAGIAQFTLTFIGFLAGAALILASIFLIVSIDEGLQGKAKTIIIETLIALLVTIVCYGIIRTFVPENTFVTFLMHTIAQHPTTLCT